MAARICPHCHQMIPTNTGFYFDEKFNLICGNCDKIAFATSSDNSREIHPYFPQQPGPPFKKWEQGVLNSESEDGE